MNVTSIEQLKEYKKGTLVELPPFAPGQPFIAKIKRPSMMKLAFNGTIPNKLLVKANELFVNGNNVLHTEDETLLPSLMQILEGFAMSMFVEPSYNELKEAGIELTDEQLMFLYNYAQSKVDSLVPFCDEPEDRNSTNDK